jgi:hypothetical protein
VSSNLTKLPECGPNVIAHCVEPKKAQHQTDVDAVSDEYARQSFWYQALKINLHKSQIDVQRCEAENIAH